METYFNLTQFFSEQQKNIVQKIYHDIKNDKYGKFINNVHNNFIIRIPVSWFIIDSKIYVLLVNDKEFKLCLAINNECLSIYKAIYKWMISNKEKYFTNWIDYSNYNIFTDLYIPNNFINIIQNEYSGNNIQLNPNQTDCLLDIECDPEPVKILKNRGTKRHRKN